MAYKITPMGIIKDDILAPVPLDDPEYLAWLALGNIPEYEGFPTEQELALAQERLKAIGIARNWFSNNPAAAAFVRLTPVEQATQIDAMTTAQLKTLLKYLTIAVSFIVKRQLL